MQKVAILIATLNRVEFLIRTINYYSSLNSPHPIFIGDASSESHEEEVLNSAKDKIEVFYFHWKGMTDRKTVKKLAEMALKSNISDYCVDQGDDDFYYLNSLSTCAEFLSLNPDYSTAQGRALSLELDQPGPYGNLKDIDIYWNKNELNGESALDRLKEISNNYWVPNFSVHRTEEFIDKFSVGLESVSDRQFGELTNVFTTAMSGKSKFINCLFLVRHGHNDRPAACSIDWITGESWYTSYAESIACLSELLSKKDNLDLKLSKKEVRVALHKLLPIGEKTKFTFYNLTKAKYIEYIDNKKLPNIPIRVYRRIKYSSFFPSKDFSKRGFRSKKSKYYNDVLLILDACKIKD